MTEAKPDEDYEAGRAAALAKEPRTAPFDGRTSRARSWLAGYDSASTVPSAGDAPAAAPVAPAPEPPRAPEIPEPAKGAAVSRVSEPDIFVALETFNADVNGSPVAIHRGITRVRRGHPLLKGREHLFAPIDLSVHYDVEQATAGPGEKRGT